MNSIDNFSDYCGEKVHFHYMDTDSFILSIKTEDLIKDLNFFKDDFYFSELDRYHQLFDPSNMKCIGKRKIETSPVLVFDSFKASR